VDIAFVDANINTFVLGDRTNKSIDVVNTASKTLTHQYTATPPFRGVFNPLGLADASGPNGVIIVDQREVWATDAPVLNCTGTTAATQVCTVVTPSSIKVLDLVTGATTHVIDTGGQRRTDELCEDVNHEVVLAANDNPLDNFLVFVNTETYSIIQKVKLDGTDPHGKITLTGVAVPTGARVAANGIEQCKFNPRTGHYYLAIPATSIIAPSGTTDGPGVVLKISRHAPFRVVETITVPTSTGCTGPQGLAIGPRHEIQLGC